MAYTMCIHNEEETINDDNLSFCKDRKPHIILNESIFSY